MEVKRVFWQYTTSNSLKITAVAFSTFLNRFAASIRKRRIVYTVPSEDEARTILVRALYKGSEEAEGVVRFVAPAGWKVTPEQALLHRDQQSRAEPSTRSRESHLPGRPTFYRRIGSFRMRLPVSVKSALATAGAIGGTPGSPTPVGGSVLFTMWTSISGISSMRSMG